MSSNEMRSANISWVVFKSSISVSSATKAFLLLLTGISLLAPSGQLPDEFWGTLIQSGYFEANWFGFMCLVVVYVLAILLMAPLSPFALTAGLLFGVWWGTFLALVALNVGAAFAFFIARYLLRQQLARGLARNGRFAGLAKVMRDDAVTAIAILRLNPLVPFNFQNYACGALGVRYNRYAVGTFLGASPFTMALVYLGHEGRQLVVASGLSIEQWMLVLSAVALVVSLPLTWAMCQKALKHPREYRKQ